MLPEDSPLASAPAGKPLIEVFEDETITVDAYQTAALDTRVWKDGEKVGGCPPLIYLTLGLAGEAGEFANKVKKVLRDQNGTLGHEQAAALAAEIGDQLWYLAVIANELGYRLSAVADDNLDTLADRKARGVLGVSLPAILVASARPAAMGRPCPSAPVLASTPGTRVLGWPLSRDRGCMKVLSSSSAKKPAKASTV